MKIKVLADSTCDLSKDLVEKLGLEIVPLTVIKDDQQYLDNITITPAEIFAHVAAGGDLCSTTAVSIGEYQDVFAKYTKEYDALIHINIGSAIRMPVLPLRNLTMFMSSILRTFLPARVWWFWKPVVWLTLQLIWNPWLPL